MHIRKINNPGTKAEGVCNGLPYDTTNYTDRGCAIHFWVASPHGSFALPAALHKAMNERDIVAATWSLGEPAGFWAHTDIE